MFFLHGVKLDYDDVLLVPKRSKLSSRAAVDIKRQFKLPDLEGKSSRIMIENIPIISSNMDCVGGWELGYTMQKHGMLNALSKNLSQDDLLDFIFYEKKMFCEGHKIERYNSSSAFFSFGISEQDQKNMEVFMNRVIFSGPHQYPIMICLDVANGHMEQFVDYVRYVRNETRDSKNPCIIMAGNVCTASGVEALIMAGADIAKVGIGSGACCTTRLVAGVGYPMLSCIIECADAAHGLGGLICADGGCRIPADVVKAFAAGSDFVMLGSMLAGTDETNSEIKEIDGKKYCNFYGMASQEALNKYHKNEEHRTAEGRSLMIPYKGSVEPILKNICAGIRSACTYVGAKRLKDLSKCATFAICKRTYNDHFEQFDAN